MKLFRLFAAAAILSIAGWLPAAAQNNNTGLAFTPTLQTAAYAAGNAMGGLQTLGFFQAQPSGIFTNFSVTSQGGATTGLTIYIFDTSPTATTCTDKSAFALGAADVPKLAMAPFALTPAIVGSGTTATFAQQTQTVSLRNRDNPQKSLLYVCTVANGAVTPGSTTDLVEKISAALD